MKSGKIELYDTWGVKYNIPGDMPIIWTDGDELSFESDELTELRAQLAAIKDILENGANGEKLAAIERVVYGGESK